MDTKEKKRLFRIASYKRADDCHYLCQVCNKPIPLTGDWLNDCWYFLHLKSRSKCDNWEYVNWFIFACKNLHIYEETLAKNLENDNCVKLFLDNYFNDGLGSFYKVFIQNKGLEALYLT